MPELRWGIRQAPRVEGHHLWAMVHLLVKHFGKDGREEVQALLERCGAHLDNPRMGINQQPVDHEYVKFD